MPTANQIQKVEDMKTRILAGLVALMGLLAACSSGTPKANTPGSSPAPGASPIVIEGAWVRGTEGAKDTSMSAAFMHLKNPTDKGITLLKASYERAGKTELHEMAMVDGKMLMREVSGGIPIPAGGLADLGPGGMHIMLMELTGPLKVGEEIPIVLTFSDGMTMTVMAPVKAFAEEEDHYHGPASSSMPLMTSGG